MAQPKGKGCTAVKGGRILVLSSRSITSISRRILHATEVAPFHSDVGMNPAH